MPKLLPNVYVYNKCQLQYLLHKI